MDVTSTGILCAVLSAGPAHLTVRLEFDPKAALNSRRGISTMLMDRNVSDAQNSDNQACPCQSIDLQSSFTSLTQVS